MDLICTVYGSKRTETKPGLAPIPPKWFYESATLCTVSHQNCLAFVSSYPLVPACTVPNDDELPIPLLPQKSQLPERAGASSVYRRFNEFSEIDNNLTHGQHYVYVCDMNTPWDVHLITAKPYEVTTLAWDTENADTLVFADRSGRIEVWRMKECLLTEWECLSQNEYPSENFIKSFFISGNRKCFVNMDNTDSGQYHEKFTFKPCSSIAQEFGQRSMTGIMLVSHTGLLVCLAIMTQPKTNNNGGNNQSSNVISSKVCLDVLRGRVKNVDISFIKDGTLLVAISNGDPGVPVRFFDIKTIFKESPVESVLILELQVDTYPGLFTKAVGDNNKASEEDKCLGIVDVAFVNGDDTDSFLVATSHPAGGRLELWELKDFQQNVHRMFHSPSDPSKGSFCLSGWHYVEQFSGPLTQIMAIATPKYSYQTGRAAACYVTVAYSDGSIQCLIRDNLQQIGSVDLPRSGNLSVEEQPSMKMSRSSVTICCMAFSSTGNTLVTIDSLGQLYFYRMSPITDPGGPHVPIGLQNSFEYSLVSGFDWLDVSMCMKPTQVESICQKLEEDFEKQSKVNQEYYYSRYMAMKSSLYRLVSSSSIAVASADHYYKAADCYAQLMLYSIHGVFKSLLGPSDMIVTADTQTEKVFKLIRNNLKDEASIDQLVEKIQTLSPEFAVDQATLQTYQHLIQWISNLCLHLFTSLPEFKHRKGPGYDLINNKTNLGMLRELLFLIRLWGSTNPGILPSYTKTSEQFDVLAKLFSLLTRYKEAEPTSIEPIIEECINLPCQVMIPALDTVITARGLSYILISQNRGPLSCQFMQEPDAESESEAIRGNFTGGSGVEQGAVQTSQFVDSVRHIYLGKKPFIIKECTRCLATSLPLNSHKKALNKGWDLRWASKCHCGGPWKLNCLNDNTGQKRNLLSSCI